VCAACAEATPRIHCFYCVIVPCLSGFLFLPSVSSPHCFHCAFECLDHFVFLRCYRNVTLASLRPLAPVTVLFFAATVVLFSFCHWMVLSPLCSHLQHFSDHWQRESQ